MRAVGSLSLVRNRFDVLTTDERIPMDRRWILSCVCLASAFVGMSCHDDADECDYKQAAYCSADATTIHRCRSGKWTPTVCDTGTACAYIDDKPVCVKYAPDSATCNLGSTKCLSQTMAAKCIDLGNGKTAWRNEICASNAQCIDGACLVNLTPAPPPVASTSIVSQRCTPDNKSVVTTRADGTVTTTSCVELVGFDAQCQTYSGGLAGCAKPKACDETFSEAGTCFGNQLRRCDMRYIVPRPIVEDCSQNGVQPPQICAVTSGKAACRATCSAPDAAAVTCSQSLATRCVASASGENVVETGASLCVDAQTQVSCNGDEVVTKACGTGETCIASLGKCIELCDSANENEVKCSASGELSICQAMGSIYGYAPTGKRHCLGDTLIQCTTTDGVYAPKKTDCNNYVHTDGTTYYAHCQSDYQGMPDYDICVPAQEGEPCNGLTSEGKCDGNTLSYCLDEDDVVVTKDCSTNTSGMTTCSVYGNYADCRRSCTASGAAQCSYNSQTEAYIVSLCAPSQVDAKALTVIDATAICLGNVLYSCDASGKTTTTDCAANGGICDTTACVYPLCSANMAPQCTAANEIVACQVHDGGEVYGISKQSVTCAPNGKCQACKDGKIVDVNGI